MKGIASACVPVLVVFGLCQVTAALKPYMNPAVKEIILQEGDELRLECRGEGRMQFSVQEAGEHGAKVLEFNILKEESSGAYTLIVNSTRKEHTGWYACAEEGVKIRNDEKVVDHESQSDIAWIYVYVNSSEPFAVDADFELLTAEGGGRLVIPCRTTSPDLRVNLEINWGMTEVPSNTRYDPKIGFILNEVGGELSGQSFECHVDGPELRTASYTLHVQEPTAYVNARIDTDQIRVVLGGDLTVKCDITVSFGTWFAIIWKVPESVPKGRWTYSNATKREGPNSHDIWETVLTVKNVEESDQGEYICIAEYLEEQYQSRAMIRVLDPGESFLNVTVEGSHHITLPEGNTATWRINIDTFPEIWSIEWIKPDGQDITKSELDDQTKYSHTQNGSLHFFIIRNLRVEDNGSHTIEVSNEKQREKINLELTVRTAPIVYINNKGPVSHMPETFAPFTCETLGSPLPNVTWIIKEYPDVTSKGNFDLKYPLNATSKQGAMGRYHLVSTLNVKINQTGEVICRSCNEIGCVDSTQHITVSDVPGLFGIIDPGLVTVGDDINVTCGASIDTSLTAGIKWRLGIDPETQEFPPSRISLTPGKTNFTWRSNLRIRGVRKSDAGEYICRVESKDGIPEEKQFELKVHDELAPRFNETNMNDTKIFIDLKVEKKKLDTSRQFVCRTEGRPIPEVTWYKDDHLLVESSQYKFSENNRKLEISYFLEGDSGRYVCKAVNRVGTSEKYMDIIVTGKSHSHTLLIGSTSVFVTIIIKAVAYMGIMLH